jgi:hypothetical protein
MCGDLASAWALFGFCAGIQGAEMCPCCTLKRIDQWRGESSYPGETVLPRGRGEGTPIPLAPSSRYVFCTLHCLLRIGEFALQRLIAACLNSNDGVPVPHPRRFTGNKKSEKQKKSEKFVDSTITHLRKKDLLIYVKEKLKEEGKEWKEYSKGEIGKVNLDMLQDVAGTIAYQQVTREEAAIEKLSTLNALPYPDLCKKVKEEFGKVAEPKKKTDLVRRLFCLWCHNRNRDGENGNTGENVVKVVNDTTVLVTEEEAEVEDSSDSVRIGSSLTDMSDPSSDRSSMSIDDNDEICGLTGIAVENDKRLTTSGLRKLGKVFQKLSLPLKFSIQNEAEVKVGRYSGKNMKKIFRNARAVFSCSELHPGWGELWRDFYDLLSNLTEDPPEGSTRQDVSRKFREGFKQWRERYEQEGQLHSDWRIYFHIVEMHAADMYEELGSLQPWANEAGEQLHALDRMFVFQRRRRSASDLSSDLLITAIRVRQSHHEIGRMQVPAKIPDEVKAAKPKLAALPRMIPLATSLQPDLW